MIPESHLHYIWANRLFRSITIGSDTIDVVEVGELNSHDGPDFLLCRLRLGSIEWAGSVEIHRRASEWNDHRHGKDARYTSVILHVVLERDCAVYDVEGREVPTAIMQVEPSVVEGLTRLSVKSQSLRCLPQMLFLGTEEILELALKLLPNRIETKLQHLRARSDSDHFNSIFYLTLMRYVGAHQNNEVMESVARTLPYHYLKKHASDPLALEAMLIGQAGLLSAKPHDEYEEHILAEYLFYRQKFSLIPIPAKSFRYLRLRPAAFPARMLAIVAQILHHEEELLSAIIRLNHKEIVRVLTLEPSDYWQSHFDFARELPRRLGGVGTSTINSLIINAVIPSAYYYAQHTGDRMLAQRALDWLYLLPAESNQYIKLFTRHGIMPRHAADTQALLELYHNHCCPYLCLKCPLAIGYFKRVHDR